MLEFWLRPAFQFGNDALRQDFSKFHAPLIERINVPNRPLHEHAMLIKRHELAERFGREPVG